MQNSSVLIFWIIYIAFIVQVFYTTLIVEASSVLYSAESYDELESVPVSAVKDIYEEEILGLERQVQLTYEESCPPVPDPSKIDTKICLVTTCVEDDDCAASHACCFNGCIYSCLPRVQPPPPFDWLEETRVKIYEGTRKKESASSWPNDYETSSEEVEASPRSLLSARGRSSDVSLPGGCLLTATQYQHLLLFRKHRHVHSW